MKALLAYDWPGNVRELIHVIERAAVMCSVEVIDTADLPPALHQAARVEVGTPPSMPLRDALAALEKQMIVQALSRAGGNRAEAARILGIARPSSTPSSRSTASQRTSARSEAAEPSENEPAMIDISTKSKTLRTATARARVTVAPQTLAAIRDKAVPKGDPLEVAKVAAVQAVKNTSQIIPYRHPLPVDFAGVEYELGPTGIEVRCTVRAIYKTGVEMEALTGATVAALTLYDMLKMLDDTMVIESVALVEKKGESPTS